MPIVMIESPDENTINAIILSDVIKTKKREIEALQKQFTDSARQFVKTAPKDKFNSVAYEYITNVLGDLYLISVDLTDNLVLNISKAISPTEWREE